MEKLYHTVPFPISLFYLYMQQLFLTSFTYTIKVKGEFCDIAESLYKSKNINKCRKLEFLFVFFLSALFVVEYFGVK